MYNSGTQTHQEYANNFSGFDQLSNDLRVIPNPAIICGATGGCAMAVALALHRHGYPVNVVNPRPVRDLAKGLGKTAKTDKIDAQMIATYGEMVQPEAMVFASETEQEMKAWLQRRQQLIEMMSAEKNRRHQATRRTRDAIDEHIDWLEKQIKAINEKLK